MELHEQSTFELVLCDFLTQEGMPSRSEFEVLSVMIHDGNKAALTQPGSGWPKQASWPHSKPDHVGK